MSDLPWGQLKRNDDGTPRLIGGDYLRTVEERHMPEQPPLPPRKKEPKGDADDPQAVGPPVDQPPLPPVKPVAEVPLTTDAAGAIVPPDPLTDGEAFVVVDPRAAAAEEVEQVGRLTHAPAEWAPTIEADPFIADDDEPDRVVQLVDDVWEEVSVAGARTPTHVQRFARGQRVLASQVAHIRARWVEHTDPVAAETK